VTASKAAFAGGPVADVQGAPRRELVTLGGAVDQLSVKGVDHRGEIEWKVKSSMLATPH
jgi:hypothetical protein